MTQRRNKVNRKCEGCKKPITVFVRNIARGGGRYCSRKCNPALRPKVTKQQAARKNNLKSKYGLTVQEYDLKVADQLGMCAICGSFPEGMHYGMPQKLHVDHDHRTKQVRDLLCMSCNRALGWFRESPRIMASAIAYVKRHQRTP